MRYRKTDWLSSLPLGLRGFLKILFWLNLGMFGGFPPFSPSAAADIWMLARSPIDRQVNGQPANDYMDLFSDGAPWARSRDQLKVFQISTTFAVRASDRDLQQVISFLRRHRIALSVGGLMLTPHNGCGIGIEGYSGPGDTQLVVERVAKLGGAVEYVAMDGPLWSGHNATGRTACHDPLSTVAKEIASKLAPVWKRAPGIKVGDVEPFGNSFGVGWTEELKEWMAAYRSATGRKLDFVQTDINWNSSNWREQLAPAVQLFRDEGVPFGVIYDGDGNSADSKAWVASAVKHFHYIEGELSIHPGQAAIESWDLYPSHLLPETNPGALTNVIFQYLALHSARN